MIESRGRQRDDNSRIARRYQICGGTFLQQVTPGRTRSLIASRIYYVCEALGVTIELIADTAAHSDMDEIHGGVIRSVIGINPVNFEEYCELFCTISGKTRTSGIVKQELLGRPLLK